MNRTRGRFKALVTVVIAMVLAPALAFAAFVSGSTGALGDFTPTANTAVDLPPDGVLNFQNVTIPSGVTVTFKRNAANTPVTILATGDVTIAGMININGADAVSNLAAPGGPGGFDGGVGGYAGGTGFRGQGPGGGGGGLSCTAAGTGGGGGFSSAGSVGSTSGIRFDGLTGYDSISSPPNGAGGAVYGNAGLIPLIGGSGGGSSCGVTSSGAAGGGGGGAILIAATGNLRIDGAITANGGKGTVLGGQPYTFSTGDFSYNASGGGSGGAIRLVAYEITGEGTISASGGGENQYITSKYNNSYNTLTYFGGAGSDGRIRFEAQKISRTTGTSPLYSFSLYPATVYPAAAPSLTITQINGVGVPQPSHGTYKTPDVTLPYNTTGPVSVTISATNITVGKNVTLSAIPETGSNILTVSGALVGTSDSSSVQLQLTIPSGTSYVLSASANF